MQVDNKEILGEFPRQQLSFNRKNKKWRVQCTAFGADKDVLSYSPVRKTVVHKQINYDLLNGKLHMRDLKFIYNPNDLQADFIPEGIQHYPIMNTKLQVLRGEEASRVFDYKVVVTDPNSISEIEKDKKQALFNELQQTIANSALSQEDAAQKIQEIQDYYNYEWQDIREMRANALLTHYMKEYNVPYLFNQGFMDAMAVGEEIYQCTIIQGEPVILKLNPRKVRVYQSGFSNRIEDADMIVIEDYWSPGRIIDTYQDVLTKEDIAYIENIRRSHASGGDEENEDETAGFINMKYVSDLTAEDLFGSEDDASIMPYDFQGNVKVSQVFWKSYRKVKKVKSYDPITGEVQYNIYPETYIINKDKGEEEQIFWINEAWQGTKIGDKIYVNMGPCPIQYNRISNPSKCHFGIIGTIYNLNDDRPFSLVDIMKPYNYLYDVIYDRLNKLIARNHGKIIRLDLAKVPNKWTIEKWLGILKTAGIAVEDSFKEGSQGQAKGKLAGGMNNASSGVIDAELGQTIMQQIQLLEFIKNEMAEVAGISKQREGQISNRETVGGVERATLQSSHITEWLFVAHDDLKKRVIECFLETAKIALRGRNKKFQYLLSDMTQKIMDFDGDVFAESDYGLVVDNSFGTQELIKNLPMLVQAGLNANKISFSAAMKIWNATSRAEKQRIIERDEARMQEIMMQQQQAQLESQQQIAQMEQETKMQQMQHEAAMNTEDNETQIIIANIKAFQSSPEPQNTQMTESEREKLNEQKREFNASHALDREKLNLEKKKAETSANLERQKIKKQKTTSK